MARPSGPHLRDGPADQATLRSLTGIRAAVIPRYTSATRPAASSTYARVLIAVKDALEAEQLQICLETSTGGWEWVTLALPE